MQDDAAYFAWIKSVGGKIYPIKVYHRYDGPDAKAYARREVIREYKLTAEQAAMSLDALSMEFPLV